MLTKSGSATSPGKQPLILFDIMKTAWLNFVHFWLFYELETNDTPKWTNMSSPIWYCSAWLPTTCQLGPFRIWRVLWHHTHHPTSLTKQPTYFSRERTEAIQKHNVKGVLDILPDMYAYIRLHKWTLRHIYTSRCDIQLHISPQTPRTISW